MCEFLGFIIFELKFTQRDIKYIIETWISFKKQFVLPFPTQFNYADFLVLKDFLHRPSNFPVKSDGYGFPNLLVFWLMKKYCPSSRPSY